MTTLHGYYSYTIANLKPVVKPTNYCIVCKLGMKGNRGKSFCRLIHQECLAEIQRYKKKLISNLR